MRQEFDNLLCTRYPKMFINRNGDKRDTCMSWGFECGDGWFTLIDRLCQNIQAYIDQNPHKQVPQVVVDQVKEKYGTLRFYTTGGDDLTRGMIWFAESMSGKICETCGHPGKVRTGGWFRALCDEHATNEENNINTQS